MCRTDFSSLYLPSIFIHLIRIKTQRCLQRRLRLERPGPTTDARRPKGWRLRPVPCTPTCGAAPPVTHLMLRDVADAVLPSVLGLRAVTDACPLPDPSGTGDRAGRPWGPGAPPTVDWGREDRGVTLGARPVLGAQDKEPGIRPRLHTWRKPGRKVLSGPYGRGGMKMMTVHLFCFVSGKGNHTIFCAQNLGPLTGGRWLWVHPCHGQGAHV